MRFSSCSVSQNHVFLILLGLFLQVQVPPHHTNLQGLQWQLAVAQLDLCRPNAVIFTSTSAVCASAAVWSMALDLAWKALSGEKDEQSCLGLSYDLYLEDHPIS